jgi:hypothetical protein
VPAEQNDLPVGLDRDVDRAVDPRSTQGNDSRTAERPVQGAAREVADEDCTRDEVVAPALAGEQDLAVVLNRDGVREIERSDLRVDPAALAEGAIGFAPGG